MRTRAAITLALLAGCAPMKSVEPPAKPAPAVQAPAPTPGIHAPAWLVGEDADALLSYYDHVRRLSPADLAREHEAVRNRFGVQKKDYQRLQLALLLSLPGAPFRDDARALALVEPLARDAAAQEPHRRFAALLQAQLTERRRQEENADALAARLKETQQKLDALKNIERSLSERDTGKALRK